MGGGLQLKNISPEECCFLLFSIITDMTYYVVTSSFTRLVSYNLDTKCYGHIADKLFTVGIFFLVFDC